MEKHPIEIAAEIVGSYEALARQLGVTKGAVHQWKSPDRKVPIEHCARIETATAGKVTRQMLRPDDWESIWPELAPSRNGKVDRAASSDDTQGDAGGSADEKPSKGRGSAHKTKEQRIPAKL